MDIEDESFPDTGITSNDASKELRPMSGNSSSDDNHFSSPRTLQEGDSSVQSSSGSSNQGRKFKAIDAPSNRGSNSNQPKFPSKAQSYQDLHSEYTKKRYQHVKSKVKQYIINIQNEGRRRQTITRHRSLPETLGDCIAPTSSRSEHDNNENDCKDCHHEEVIQLKTLNEYLQENLQEKMIQMARLKRSADNMQIELMQLKEKERQRNGNKLFLQRGRHVLSPKPCQFPRKKTIGTQTQELFLVSSNPPPSPASQEPQPEVKKKRLKFQSSQCKFKRNDLAIDFETEDDDEMISKDRGKSNRRKKCKVFRGKNWKTMFGSCTGVVPCCGRNGSMHDDFVYMQVPLNETTFVESKA